MTAIGSLAPAAATPPDETTRIRALAKQLEGVFVEQLFKAMRETVPSDGLTHGGTGEDMFTGMLDQRLSTAAPARWSHDAIADALVRQLAPRLHSASAPTSPDAIPSVPASVAGTGVASPSLPTRNP